MPGTWPLKTAPRTSRAAPRRPGARRRQTRRRCHNGAEIDQRGRGCPPITPASTTTGLAFGRRARALMKRRCRQSGRALPDRGARAAHSQTRCQSCACLLEGASRQLVLCINRSGSRQARLCQTSASALHVNARRRSSTHFLTRSTSPGQRERDRVTI
jgi:hypothetical protein